MLPLPEGHLTLNSALLGGCHELPDICQGRSSGTGVLQGTQHHSSGEGRWVLCVCEGQEVFGNTVRIHVCRYFLSTHYGIGLHSFRFG